MLLKRMIARTEAYVKGMMFDCRSCGQCVLDKTGLICPMSCPKGLRNGPCGGTLNGACEVYPDKKCVWVRIHERTAKDSLEQSDLIASPDSNLFHTSSYLNRLSGRDIQAQHPVTPLQLGVNRKQMPLQTASGLERVLKQGKFVHTCEIRSPREADFSKVREEVRYMTEHFDAVNTTAYLNGKPSLPSSRTALELKKMGLEPIVQSTCRDHTKTSFVAELINNMMNDVHTMLCLTGDSYVGTPKIKQVFDMDSSLMLYEARYLREHSKIHFTGETMKRVPRPFLGTAINPFTTPANIPIRRLKQKTAAGADFTQTQLVFDLERFREFMCRFTEEGLDRDLFMLVGVPIVISKKACEMLPYVPGIHLPEKVAQSFRSATDVRAAGISFARDMIAEVREMPGVSGVHLMLMGTDHSVLPDIVAPQQAELHSDKLSVAG
jgi:methylenetetrahydrofolate reductase (NADPH)